MDMLCSEYGWTIDYVFGHTKDQVMLLSQVINKRKNDDIKFMAAVHGAELKGSGGGDNSLDLENDIDKLGSIGINVVKE